MYHEAGTHKLESGEAVTLARIEGPDPEWSGRVGELLGHKGDPWNWQNKELLTRDCGISAWFHILHRDGDPFANALVASWQGVGLLAHVYTRPKARRQGAARFLVHAAMDHFRDAGGQALYLWTEYDSGTFRLYQSHGFQPLEPQSGYMAWYRETEEAFERRYFGGGPVRMAPLQWRHWPMACALFMGPYPGVVRCAPCGLLGRRSPEGPLLPLLRTVIGHGEVGPTGQAVVMEAESTGAAVGLAAWIAHPIWPDSCLMDVYCHPGYWEHAHELFHSLPMPGAGRYVAYADPDCPEKPMLLRAAGFRQVAVLPGWVSADAAKTRSADVLIFEKR